MDKILTKNGSILIADGDVLTIEQSSGGGSSANLQSSKSYTVAASGSQIISPDSGYDGMEEVALSVPAGTAGTPTATKGTVSSNSISVTPSVTNTAGWITGSTKNGTAVTVSASELVSGTKSITANGTDIDVTNYAAVDVSVSSGGYFTVTDTTDTAGGTIRTITPTAGTPVVQSGRTVEITENGTTTIQPSSGCTSMSDVEVTVDVAGEITEAPDNDVIFIDYDGTIVYSYSAAEFANLTALPPNPTHEGLTAQGWNWTLSDAKTYVADCGMHIIGQNYVTTSGNTEIDICVPPVQTPINLRLTVNGTVTVNWGDQTTPTTITDTNTNTSKTYAHTYSATGGRFTIVISRTSGTYSINHTNPNGIITMQSTSANSTDLFNYPYAGLIENVRLGSNMTIGSLAFKDCVNLQTITIPRESIMSNYGRMFEDCFALKALVIPPGGLSALGYCIVDSGYSLKYLSLSKQSNDYQNSTSTVANKCYFSKLCGGSTLAAAGASGSYTLKTICFPSSVTIIPANMASSCYALSTVTIPSGVTTIGNGAFGSCYGLKEIHFKPSSPPTLSSSNVFTSLPKSCTFIIPYNSESSYTTATNYPASILDDNNGYVYIGFGTFTNGGTLPTEDSAGSDLTWYANIEDCLAETNSISVGNGSEIYCRYDKY